MQRHLVLLEDHAHLVLLGNASLLFELEHAPQLSKLLEDLQLRPLTGLDLLVLQHLKALHNELVFVLADQLFLFHGVLEQCDLCRQVLGRLRVLLSSRLRLDAHARLYAVEALHQLQLARLELTLILLAHLHQLLFCLPQALFRGLDVCFELAEHGLHLFCERLLHGVESRLCELVQGRVGLLALENLIIQLFLNALRVQVGLLDALLIELAAVALLVCNVLEKGHQRLLDRNVLWRLDLRGHHRRLGLLLNLLLIFPFVGHVCSRA